MPIGDETVITGKIKLLVLEQVHDVIVLLLQAFQEPFEDHAGWRGVAILDQIVELRAIDFELLHVGLQEIEVKMIERVQIAVQKSRGDFVIQRLPQVMLAFQNAGGEAGDGCVVGPRLQHHRIRRLGAEKGALFRVEVKGNRGSGELPTEQKHYPSHVVTIGYALPDPPNSAKSFVIFSHRLF